MVNFLGKWGKLSAIPFAGALSLATLTTLPAAAATLTWNFNFKPTQGIQEQWGEADEDFYEVTPLPGPFSIYSGFLSYNDSLLTGQGSETINIDRQNLNVNFPNINQPLVFYEGLANFENGNLASLNINWEPCTASEVCIRGGSFFGTLRNQNSRLSLFDDQLGGPHYLRTYTGIFTASQQTEKISEPALVWGLLTLSINFFSKKAFPLKKKLKTNRNFD